uniref:Secreted protein n=1 Tax=Ixodes scapularis TaxID=6945 RepID=A0A4D5RFE5_IXOSC
MFLGFWPVFSQHVFFVLLSPMYRRSVGYVYIESRGRAVIITRRSRTLLAPVPLPPRSAAVLEIFQKGAVLQCTGTSSVCSTIFYPL